MSNIIDISSEGRIKTNQPNGSNAFDRISTTQIANAGNTSNIQVSDRTEPASIPPKGHPVPGVDYGLDLLTNENDRPNGDMMGSQHPRQSQRTQQYRQQPSQYQPSMPQQQQFQYGDNSSQSIPASPIDKSGMSMPGMGMSMQDMPGMGMGMPGMSDSASIVGSDMGFLTTGTRDKIAQLDQQPQQQIGYEEIRKRKINHVAEFRRLKSQGYVPEGQKDITMSTSLEEMEDIVQRLTDQRDVDNSIKFQRKILIGFAGIAESICENDEWNIFELNLNGWSQNITDNISEYDEVFEELYHKYKDKVSIAPEIKLIGMVAGSAYMFHMTRDIFNRDAGKLPGVDAVMQRDPELRRKYQEIATEIARENGVTPYNTQSRGGGIMNLLGGMPWQQGTAQTRPQHPAPPTRSPMQPPTVRATQAPPRRTRTRIPMDDPDDVDGLLQSLNAGPETSNGLYQEQEIDLSEIERFSDLD